MFQLAKYATATTIYFSMVKRGVVDLAQNADWTPATGDTKISINGGTLANTANNPAIVAGTNGVLWALALTTSELTGADIRVQIVDSATKAVEDQSLAIYTYGHASAKFVCDFSAAALGALMPTTAGRTLDVAATGEAGVDLDNVLMTNGSYKLGVTANGTFSGTHTTTTADLGANAPARDISRQTLVMGTKGLSRLISSYDTATGVASWAEPLAAAPVDGDTWSLQGTAPNNATASIDAAGVRAALGMSNANLDAQLSSLQSDTDNIQTRLPAALVGGRMDASVGAVATDAITAAAVSGAAVTKMQNGLALSTEVAPLAAIKAQTDKLDFDTSNRIKSHVKAVADITVQQNGSGNHLVGGPP